MQFQQSAAFGLTTYAAEMTVCTKKLDVGEDSGYTDVKKTEGGNGPWKWN